MRTVLVVLVVFIILLSGCVGSTSSDPQKPATPEPATSSPTPTATPTPTASLTPTATPTPEPPDNPWGKEPIVVSINNSVNPDRDLTEEVNASLEYWEEHGLNYSYYEANYTLIPNATSSDIEVRLVEELNMCGFVYKLNENYLGCATNLTEGAVPADTEVVRILDGRTDNSTEETIKHEFGHLHGLGHDDEPQPLMNKSSEINYKSKPDAVNRSNSWDKSNFSVYTNIDDLDGHAQDDTREGVQRAFKYYESGADGHVPEGLGFILVDNRSDADIVINFTDNTDDKRSIGQLWGHDIDSDDQLEYYTQMRITVNRISLDRRGWHVGYWLASAFGMNSEDELPPPFVDADIDDRENW